MLEFIAVGLAAASLILHFVAPLTKTKKDDKVRDAVDFVKDKVLPVLPKAEAKEPGPVFKAPAGAKVRDQRDK